MTKLLVQAEQENGSFQWKALNHHTVRASTVLPLVNLTH